MRRLVAWVAGAAGGLAAYRALRRAATPAAEAVPASPDAPDPRAEELRARLEHTKETEDAPVEPDADSRRRAVHDEARAAIDEMRDGGTTA
jgi:hypothetical protein